MSGMERRDPLPVGRYWLFVKGPGMDGGKQFQAFTDWLVAQNGAADEYSQAENRPVQVVSTSEGDADEMMTFLIFKITKPTPRWPPESGLGFPNHAAPNVKGVSDVTQRPEPEPDATGPGGAVEQISGALKVIGYGAITAYLLGKLLTRK